jgi:hypothetical protein
MPNGEQQSHNGDRPHELVVDLPHLELIRAKLSELRLEVVGVEESAELALALVDIANFDDYATNNALTDMLKATVVWLAADEENPTDAGTVPLGDDPSNLDRLLYCLRRMIGKENNGKYPAMGKNREVGTVAGQPHLSGTADEYPEPDEKPAATEEPQMGRGIRVGVLDTRLFAHPDLHNYVAVDGALFTGEQLADPARTQYWAHGTFIAGLVRRFAPSAELVVRWVLDEPRATATAWDVARAIVAFNDSGVHILCLAMGGYSGRDDKRPLVLTRAIEKLDPRIHVLAAAGNRARRNPPPAGPPPAVAAGEATSIELRPIWPAALSKMREFAPTRRVTAVGAIDRQGEPVDFSPALAWVNLTAWGAGVTSMFLIGDVVIDRQDPYTDYRESFPAGYARWSGTSAAVAVVAGRLATVASENGGDIDKALAELDDEARRRSREVHLGGVRVPR